MPALVPILGVARCVLPGTMQGVQAVNVFHVRFDDPHAFTQSQIDGLATAIRAAYVTRFIPLINGAFTLNDCLCTDLSSDLGVVGAKTGSNAGAKTGNISANQAQCVTWRIARHYRGGHPRTYLPPPGSGDITNANTWTAAHVTAMGNAAEGFRTDIQNSVSGADAFRLVCVHRYRGWTLDTERGKRIPTPLVTPLVDGFTGSTFDARIDSQRRRLGKDR